MKLRLVALLLATAATADLRYFRYERVILNTPSQQLQTCAAVNPAIFAHAAPLLSDLRLYHDGKETPYAVRFAAPVAASAAKISPLNLGRQNGRVVFDAEMPEGSYSDIDLDIGARDFIATVDVSGSHSQSSGLATKIGSYTIFDFTGQKLGRSTVLHLPESDFRNLHFRIDGPLKPEDVGGITVASVSQSKAQYVTAAETSQVTQKDRDTLIEFAIPANVPVDRVEFVPGASPVNFSRNITITVTKQQRAVESERGEPTTYSDSILRIHGVRNGHRIDEERLSIDVPGGDATEATAWPTTWLIRVDNGDDPPVALKSVKLEMLERTLCFDSMPGTSYTLYYGDAALQTPRYDYATLFSEEPGAARAALGPERNNPEYQPRPDKRPFTERHPALLWTALVLVIVLLGGIALRSAKQVSTR